ncbi:MAG: hypothetical protein KDH93_28435 [Rhodoferax sp.]|nr:hypothetical protein [Rhodoferax sp.]MCB2043023.1 hypothetical protein [Rhodoferax sp.]MCP5263930.1 hypothetical protein [Rhodoferax sp.]MCW5630364.1 hypothetical protein [Rhodoferax sp.]
MPPRLRNLAIAALVGATCTVSHASLETRAGGAAVFDTELDLTWIVDPHLAAVENFGVAGITAIPVPSLPGIHTATMSWDTAMSWLDAMNAHGGSGYLGVNSWRLPATLQPDASCSNITPTLSGIVLAAGTGCVGSEMGYLRTVEGISLTSVPNTPPFTNLGGIGFWSGTELPVAAAENAAFTYVFNGNGVQGVADKSAGYGAWAVAQGDVLSPVPAPAAVWMFGAGLCALLARRRVRQAA